MLYSPHMAANKKPKASLDRVLSTVERSFADLEGKMERGFAAVADDITDIKSKMATKDDIAKLGGQLTSVERELKSIRRDLDDLREKVENVSGFRKKIDHALSASPRSKSISASTRRSPPNPLPSCALAWCRGQDAMGVNGVQDRYRT
jgi:chromosome segregation ATPase